MTPGDNAKVLAVKMNPLEILDEFLKDSFACDCHTLNGNMFRAYCHAAEEVDRNFVLGHIDAYAREKNIAKDLVSRLKIEVSLMIQEFYDKTNEKLVASIKKQFSIKE